MHVAGLALPPLVRPHPHQFLLLLVFLLPVLHRGVLVPVAGEVPARRRDRRLVRQEQGPVRQDLDRVRMIDGHSELIGFTSSA